MAHDDKEAIPGRTAAGATNAISAVTLVLQPTKDFRVRAPALIQQAIGKSGPEVVIQSNTYRDALLEDFRNLPIDNAKLVDQFFSLHAFPSIFAQSPAAHVEAWEYILGLIQTEDDGRYRQMHKGTPFYFAGMASYLARDFEKALFYMDAALEEDLRRHKDLWFSVPSGKFILLDIDSPDQFARPLVVRTRALFDEVMATVLKLGRRGLSVKEFGSKLVYPAMSTAPEKRSEVTGLISFLLEFPSRTTELSLAGSRSSTAEPFFLHLFKGTLLFETLLKTSSAGSTIQQSKPKATIDKFLQNQTIYSAFGFSSAPQGLRGDTFDDVIDAIKKDSATDFTQKAIRATWGIRNKVGHSMAWPSRPSLSEYRDVFYLIVGALSATIDSLHPE